MSELKVKYEEDRSVGDRPQGVLIISDSDDTASATIFLRVRAPIGEPDHVHAELDQWGMLLEGLDRLEPLRISAMKSRSKLLRDLSDAEKTNSISRLGSEAL